MAGDTRLSLPAREHIAQAAQRSETWISAITPWEIGMLVAKGRLALAQDVLEWIELVLALPGLRLAPWSRRSPWPVRACPDKLMAIRPTGSSSPPPATSAPRWSPPMKSCWPTARPAT